MHVAVRRAVTERDLERPVVVGHAISGIHAAQFATRGVVNVDQPLQIEPFIRLVRSLRGPEFPSVFQIFVDSWPLTNCTSCNR
jgi:hypothetical protein